MNQDLARHQALGTSAWQANLAPAASHRFGKASARALVARVFAALAVAMFGPVAARADEEKPKDAYESVWNSVSDLLRRREYGSAAAMLDSLADDPAVRYHRQQLVTDLLVVGRLQMFERMVHEEAAALPVDSLIEISGIKYALVRYETTPKGDWLVLKSQATSSEVKKLVKDLPSANWMKLAESRIQSLDRSALTLAVFLGFDRSPDAKTARKYLNQAAAEGEDAAPWLARLQAAADRKQAAAEDRRKNNDEPIVGRWTVWNLNAKLGYVMELRSNGTGVIVFPPEAARKIRRQKRAVGKLVAPTKWVKSGEDRYRVTAANGATQEISISGDRFWGVGPATRIRGMRHAEK